MAHHTSCAWPSASRSQQLRLAFGQSQPTDTASSFHYLPGMDRTIDRDSLCFCCGSDNERGLHLAISYPEKGAAETSLEVPTWFTGWKNMTHGGLLATLLDEIMAHACVGMSQRAVTAEITVRFQKAVETGARIRAHGKVEEARGRVLSTHGWLYDAEGSIIAEATGRFIATTRVSRSKEPLG